MTIHIPLNQLPTRPDQTWRKEAACNNIDIINEPDPFFTYDNEKIARNKWNQARALCAGCPVQRECLEDVLVDESAYGGVSYGFRGGMPAQERRVLIRKLQTTNEQNHTKENNK